MMVPKMVALANILNVYLLIGGTSSYQSAPPQNKRNLQWEQRYEELKRYKIENGNTHVPQSYKSNAQLGRWVRRQRLQYGTTVKEKDAFEQCDDLTMYRIQKLIDVGFSFHWRKDIWSQRLQELKDFINIHGHSRVPIYEKGKWYKLGLWVRNQRTMYNRMMEGASGNDAEMYNFLTKERIEMLNSVEVFSWDVQEDIWMERYEKLVHFKEKFGHADVSSRYKDDSSLLQWVKHQKRSKGRISKERVKLLDDLDFIWGNKHDIQWWDNYEALCCFKEEFGTCIVPKTYHDDKLYNWTNNNRHKCTEYSALVTSKEKILSAEYISAVPGLNSERIEALKEINFCWLPEIGENGEMTTRPLSGGYRRRSTRRAKTLCSKVFEKKAVSLQPRPNLGIIKKTSSPVTTPPKKENGVFIPFPWDEI